MHKETTCEGSTRAIGFFAELLSTRRFLWRCVLGESDKQVFECILLFTQQKTRVLPKDFFIGKSQNLSVKLATDGLQSVGIRSVARLLHMDFWTKLSVANKLI